MYQPATGMRYVRFLKDLHNALVFDWYLEVGCRTGRSFAPARGKTIAVDPFFKLEHEIVGQKPALHVMQQTSDDFFDSGFLAAIQAKLSFSFLDGMHLFEFLLRDFINTEKYSATDGLIALHDCCPYNFEMTTRAVEDAPREA